MKKINSGIILLALAATACSTSSDVKPIDRQALLKRNNPTVESFDTLASLTVGNGSFAATVDFTGLQSFPSYYKKGVPLCSMSEWGWHSFPNEKNLKHSETCREMDLGHGHKEVYAVEYKDKSRNNDATTYFRVNPHRLNLGQVGLRFTDASGKEATPEEITDIHQTLDLYDGVIESSYSVAGKPVEVETATLQASDGIIARVKSDLLSEGLATVDLTLPYPTGVHADDATDLSRPEAHTSAVVERGDRSALIRHDIDSTCYYVLINWEGDATLTEKGNHVYSLSSTAKELPFSVEYLENPVAPASGNFSYTESLEATEKKWNDFWDKGAMVDFSECTDSRAPELERRVVLSQYLTEVNCASSTPPQETGLTYNSWFGRPHLEMIWWHAVDFALWNRPGQVERILDWYATTALPIARDIAARQGFKGARWMKMTDPDAGEAPSNTGSFLIWQQPHVIYMAEEAWRANPSDSILKKYAGIVEETAVFMADYAKACAPEKGDIKLFGHTAMQESMSKDFSFNHPFELAYWRYGIGKAQEWRERQGLSRHKDWDELTARLSPLPQKDSIYTAGESVMEFGEGTTAAFDPYVAADMTGSPKISEEDFALKSRSDHPAVLGACGLLPDMGHYDRETMRRTLRWVMDNWNWPTTWGWDYGMIAMCAARLGERQTAVDALLIDKGKNTYLVSGHNFQEPKRLRLYLPGNGSLLDAVAMMCAGWDGCESGPNPGFPDDGTWNVRWEGLRPMQ